MYTATRGPMLLSTHNSSESDWSRIDGEVYEIDRDTREAMDILEGVSSGFYYRENIVVDLHVHPDKDTDPTATATTSQRQVVSECYFYTVQASDEDLVEARPLLGVYDDTAHDEYVAAPINNEILSILQGSSSP